jgi:hypothetical protein
VSSADHLAHTKGKISLACYALAIVLAFVHYLWSYALFILVALLWLVPDRRIGAHVEKTD